MGAPGTRSPFTTPTTCALVCLLVAALLQIGLATPAKPAVAARTTTPTPAMPIDPIVGIWCAKSVSVQSGTPFVTSGPCEILVVPTGPSTFAGAFVYADPQCPRNVPAGTLDFRDITPKGSGTYNFQQLSWTTETNGTCDQFSWSPGTITLSSHDNMAACSADAADGTSACLHLVRTAPRCACSSSSCPAPASARSGPGRSLSVGTAGENAGVKTAVAVRRAGVCSYVALGDSYSSGEGLPPFSGGACHRSLWAYPQLVIRELGFPGYSFVACSGAFSLGNHGNNVFYQLDEVPTVVRKYAKLVTLTVGGNDVGFGDIVRFCVTEHLVFGYRCTGPFAVPFRDQQFSDHVFRNVESFFAEQLSRARHNIEEVLHDVTRAYPGAEVIVLGYPQLFPSSSANDCAALRVFGLPIHRFVGAFAARDIPVLHGLVSELNDVIRTMTYRVGGDITFLDPNASGVWQGHDACSARSWFTDVYVGAKSEYSLHPNAEGQNALALGVVFYDLLRGAGNTGGSGPN